MTKTTDTDTVWLDQTRSAALDDVGHARLRRGGRGRPRRGAPRPVPA